MPHRLPPRPVTHPSIRRLASAQGGVVSRRQLYAAGVPRWEVAAHVRAGRWRLLGDQAVCLHNGDVDARGRRWAAVLHGGPRACLDGVSALIASGLERFEEQRIRVSVPRGATIRRHPLYDIRQTRRWSADDLAPNGVPRTRPEVAAIRAALWAATDRQATYLLSLVVQQGLAKPEQLAEQAMRIRRDKRRALLHATILDLADGARSLGELDVARELRRRGLPAPDRQVLRRGRHGRRYYLDLFWSAYGLVVEVDGIQHSWVENVVDDALRQNDLTIQSARVLRLPLLGLRLRPDEFFAQIEQALRAGGYAAA